MGRKGGVCPDQWRPGRSDRELAEVAAKIRALFVDQEGAANGGGDRFVVSAQVDAQDAAEADSWGRSVPLRPGHGPARRCCTAIRQAKNVHGPPDVRQMSSTEIGIHRPEYDRNPTAVAGSFSISMVPTRRGPPPVELGNRPL